MRLTTAKNLHMLKALQEKTVVNRKLKETIIRCHGDRALNLNSAAIGQEATIQWDEKTWDRD